MLFLMPNQQYRGTEGKLLEVTRGNSPMSLHMRGMWEGMEFPHVPSHERNGGGNGNDLQDGLKFRVHGGLLRGAVVEAASDINQAV